MIKSVDKDHEKVYNIIINEIRNGEIMITQTMIHNSIEDTKKLIRQNLEKGLFFTTSLLIPVDVLWLLKDLEEKLRSGLFEEKELEKTFDLTKEMYEIVSDSKLDSDVSDKRLEDMEVTVADDNDIFNEVRALLKKYILEDKRQQTLKVVHLVSRDIIDADEINSIYQKEFEK